MTTHADPPATTTVASAEERSIRGYWARTPEDQRAIDITALRDAIAALDSPYEKHHQGELRGKIASLRGRLEGAGIDPDLTDAKGLQFIKAPPDVRDPPATTRYRVERNR